MPLLTRYITRQSGGKQRRTNSCTSRFNAIFISFEAAENCCTIDAAHSHTCVFLSNANKTFSAYVVSQHSFRGFSAFTCAASQTCAVLVRIHQRVGVVSFHFQVVKFTKSFELLSPKCSADADSRYVPFLQFLRPRTSSGQESTFDRLPCLNQKNPPLTFVVSLQPSHSLGWRERGEREASYCVGCLLRGCKKLHLSNQTEVWSVLLVLPNLNHVCVIKEKKVFDKRTECCGDSNAPSIPLTPPQGG